MRGEQKFVLTHEDLAARNLIMKDGKVTGIVDWEYSEFFRGVYGVYGVCACDCHSWCQECWKLHLKEISEPCGFKRAMFTAAIKGRGW